MNKVKVFLKYLWMGIFTLCTITFLAFIVYFIKTQWSLFWSFGVLKMMGITCAFLVVLGLVIVIGYLILQLIVNSDNEGFWD